MSFLTFYQKRLTSSVSYEVSQAVKVNPPKCFQPIKSVTDCMYSIHFLQALDFKLPACQQCELYNQCSNGYIKNSIFIHVCVLKKSP